MAPPKRVVVAGYLRGRPPVLSIPYALDAVVPKLAAALKTGA
ncbi:hypothetical protein [Amycolatopsis sp. NPDC051903]